MRAYGLRNFIPNLEKDSYFHWTSFIGHHSALEEVGIHSEKKIIFLFARWIFYVSMISQLLRIDFVTGIYVELVEIL